VKTNTSRESVAVGVIICRASSHPQWAAPRRDPATSSDRRSEVQNVWCPQQHKRQASEISREAPSSEIEGGADGMPPAKRVRQEGTHC
jgi:hypothetical protein